MNDAGKTAPVAGAAGGGGLRHRESVLLEMGKALRAFSIYPAQHPQRANLVGQAFGSVQLVVGMLGDLTYQVARTGFIYYDTKLGGDSPLIRELAQEMHLRQVKSFSLRQGLSLPDFSSFLEMLLEKPERFRQGRFIERWIQERQIRTIWVNEIDFGKLATVGTGDKIPAEEGEGGEQDQREELLKLIFESRNPEEFGQLLREAELLIRPWLDAGQFEEAWRLVNAVSLQAEEEWRPGVEGELIRPLALRTVRAVVKGKFLAYLLERYSRPEEREREALHLIFYQLGPAVVEEVINLLVKSEAMTGYRPLVDLVLELGSQARLPLEAQLKDENPLRVKKAAFLLGELRDKAAVSALKPLLEHKDAKVRWEVIRALARIRSLEASRVLVGAFSAEKDLEVKMIILQVLGENKDLAAVGPLIKFLSGLPLREDTVVIQEAVIETLGRIGSREALPLLIKILNQWSVFNRSLSLRLRVKAAEALGRLGGESAMQALARYARGGDPLSKTCAAVLEVLLKNEGRPVERMEENPK